MASPPVVSIGEYLWASAVPRGRCSSPSLSAAPSGGGTALVLKQMQKALLYFIEKSLYL